MKKFLLRLLKSIGLYQEVIETKYLVPSQKFKQGDRIIVRFFGENKSGFVVGDVVWGESGIRGLSSSIEQMVPIKLDDGEVMVKPIDMIFHAPLLNQGKESKRSVATEE